MRPDASPNPTDRLQFAADAGIAGARDWYQGQTGEALEAVVVVVHAADGSAAFGAEFAEPAADVEAHAVAAAHVMLGAARAALASAGDAPRGNHPARSGAGMRGRCGWVGYLADRAVRIAAHQGLATDLEPRRATALGLRAPCERPWGHLGDHRGMTTECGVEVEWPRGAT